MEVSKKFGKKTASGMATYINIFWWHTYFRLIFGWTMKENSKTGSWHSRPPTRRQNKFKVARFHFETCYDSWYLLIVFFVTILNQKTTKFGLCWTELPFRTRISQKPFRGGVFDLGYEGYPEVGLVWAYLCMMRYLPYASCPNENTYAWAQSHKIAKNLGTLFEFSFKLFFTLV